MNEILESAINRIPGGEMIARNELDDLPLKRLALAGVGGAIVVVRMRRTHKSKLNDVEVLDIHSAGLADPVPLRSAEDDQALESVELEPALS